MKKLQALFCALLVCTLLLSGLPRTASAAYPDRPVTIIIPFGPGGAVDIAARILAEYFQNKHQITLNIVCKAGGAGAPAMLDVAKARPDGYTFGFPAIATFSTTPQIKKTGYTLADFRAVVQVTNMWLSLAVNADSGIKTINELMAAAKAKGYGKVAVAGGVAANSRIRADLQAACAQSGDQLYLPELRYCGDNAAMVGCQGYYEWQAGHTAGWELNAYATRDISLG